MKVEFSNKAKLPTRFGNFIIQGVREETQNGVFEHLVIFSNELLETPLVRVHSECLTGDVFGSLKCDCGGELALAMEQIAQSKQGGMLIYLRQEGRGIGLFNKVNAYALQDQGYDTIEANRALGLADDARNYDVVGEIFKHFGIKKIQLLTNNPHKIKWIEKYVDLERSSIIIESNCHNAHYLQVKKDKMGHLLEE
ncbi:GTP cyclohydrolase II [Helicobacter anatolicus]|uniref:GTP cyclohydrolase II n=1 Tax=Helicobacter anatolicus TaxID=2905874 RepID=UPI001E5F7E3A|nr:GTP cyclohydrolase II [Helicobacter anatolicus]MCE3037620.1 GTP cyclohydrolase II [Helicobacter anatolicus]MCE3040418.1 GTP cyclohydrolase II [Helicobacter anatolicus]